MNNLLKYKYIEFGSKPAMVSSDEILYAFIPKGLVGTGKLFIEYKSLLNLPDYFGQNWDALDECLRDFNWFTIKQIIIYHDDLPNINEKEMKIYIDVLNSA